jgi:acetolactate synthase-1/2/3 large subunit
MFAPGTLWTAAHHRIPMLYVVLNNRAYHQEYMHLEAMAGRRSRGVANADVGTTLSDPKELAPALKRAIAMVKSGQPALADVVTEPR